MPLLRMEKPNLKVSQYRCVDAQGVHGPRGSCMLAAILSIACQK
jgi:hypothetical protein